MKRARLIPIAVISFVAVAFASAAPATFAFNTSNFNFTDYALTTGYLGFAMNGNQLVVDLSSAGPVSSIPAITLWVPGPTTAYDGASVYPSLGNIGDISLTSDGSQITGFTVAEDSTTLPTVVAAYVKSLEGVGFTAEQQAAPDTTMAIYDFVDKSNGLQLRAVFQQLGANVSAHLSGPAAI